MRLTSMRKMLFIVATIGWATCAVWPAGSGVERMPFEKGMEEAPGLLLAGRYDEALWAYDGSGYKMGEELLRQVAEAKDRGAMEEAVRLNEACFYYFPFGPLYWDQKWKGWSEAAFDYIELRRTSGQAAGGEERAQDIAAMEPYRRLMQSYEKRDFNTCKQLADEIVEKYPLSLFCPAAVLSVCDLAQGRSPPPAPVVATYEAYLARMKKANSPKRGQIVVMLDYAPACIVYGKGEQDQREGLSKYLEIANLTDVTYEKSYYALQAAEVGLAIAKEDSLELSREVFLEFLAKHPGASHAYQARRGLVRSYVIANQSEQAEKVLRALEQTAPADTDLSEEFLTVAKGYFGAGEYDKSLLLLQQLLERFPESGSAPTAYLRLGELYEALGEEDKMLTACKIAAGLMPADGHTFATVWSDARNKAFEFLGNHYMKTQDWAEALKWWRAWEPTSWCGTCLEGMKDRRDRNMATCKMNVWLLDDGLRITEEWLFSIGKTPDPAIPIMIVEFYRERNMLQTLEERLHDILDQFRYAAGARIALEYIGLIRLAENKDAEQLWNFLARGDPLLNDALDWKVAKAADLLVSIPEAAKPLALARLEDENWWGRVWAAALLGRMGGPEVLPPLKEKIRNEQNERTLAHYFYGLALVGTDEAYAIIKEYAEQGTGNHRAAAEQVLKKYPQQAGR